MKSLPILFSLSTEKTRLIKNFLALSVLQGANYLLPLITFPYLVRVLGMEYFGLLSFATAVISYFNIVVSYGFNFTATREIAVNRIDKNKVVEIFSSVVTIKLILTSISFIFLVLIVFLFEKLRADWSLYLFTFGTVIGQALLPVWFFQGMERMKYITYLDLLSKVLFTLAIFIFVQRKEDYYIVPVLTSIGSIGAGLISFFIINKEFDVRIRSVGIAKIRMYLIDGWDIFISRIFSSLYKNTNVIVLGVLTNNTIVGYYSIAQRLIKAMQAMQDVVGNTLFPFLTKKYDKNKRRFFDITRKYLILIITLYFISFIAIFLYSNQLVILVTGSKNDQIFLNLKILSFVLILGGMNYYFGILGLVTMNYKKDFSQFIIITGIVNIITSIIFVTIFQDLGASLAAVISEVVLLALITRKILEVRRSVI